MFGHLYASRFEAKARGNFKAPKESLSFERLIRSVEDAIQKRRGVGRRKFLSELERFVDHNFRRRGAEA